VSGAPSLRQAEHFDPSFHARHQRPATIPADLAARQERFR
jgi:hypothetical protein